MTVSLLRRGRRLPEPVAAGETIASVRDVCLTLGGASILRDVTLDIRAGEVLALVGPNGAGKSSLLGALTGDLAVSGGDVRMYGRPVGEWSNVEAAMRRSVLLQQVMLSFPFTVLDVVTMGRAPWANTPYEDDDEIAVAEAMRLADIEAFAERRFNSLSGGERARAALARVLAQRTQLVLLDEPTAALDLHHQELVLRVARERAAAGDALVIVLHDLNLAAAYADRVAILSRGELAAYGVPAEVFTGELLSTVYLHQIDVLEHPYAATPIILPRRQPERPVRR